MIPHGSKPAAACFLLAVFCFSLLPRIKTYLQVGTWQNEPYFSSPVSAPTSGVQLRNDAYGKGYYGASRNRGRKHEGVDLLLEIGQPISASKSGRISSADFDTGYGNYIEMIHPDGFSTRYAHLSRILVEPGDWVAQGSIIGMGGKSGNAAHTKIRPHLHFEIRYAGQPLNPGGGWMRCVFK